MQVRQTIQKLFNLEGHTSTIKGELLAGLVTFFTVVYIIIVNASILADGGIPLEAGIIATALTAFVGCLLMGLWGNSPIVLVPGMGVNALFSYTIVHTLGLSWQEALGAVFVSGLLFMLIAFTRLSAVVAKAIPDSLKEAITAGIGVFLTFIGLQKGGLVVANDTTFVQLGKLSDPHAIVTICTLLLTLVLFARQVKGGFLIAMAAGTGLAMLFGLVDLSSTSGTAFSLADYTAVLGAMSFDKIASVPFWIATYTLAMVVVFENIGLINSMVQPHAHKFDRSLQANALSVVTAGLLGTSPTVASVESAAGIAAGGKTGLTALTTGTLFLLSLFCIPLIKWIPDSAIAPVLIVIGGLMIQSVKNIRFEDFTEGFPAFLIIVLIPFTYSIADGIAFGFILYPLLKIALGKSKEVARPLYVISGLFLLNFFIHVMQ